MNKDIEELKLKRANDKTYWDVPKDQPIEVFDPTLSYELTGYRPIDQTHSLDFNPEWFIEARKNFTKNKGKYCTALPNSKRWKLFWDEEYRRCKYGLTINGYTLTGDNYFFLNYYQLPTIDQNEIAGNGTSDDFPNFMVSQYMFFHYLQICRATRKNACLMKARSIGFSEIMASIAARMYTTIKKSRTVVTCYDERFLKGTFSKIDHALTFINANSDGFFKPRLKDTELEIKSGFQTKIDGQFVDAGWMSIVKGILANKPSNIRGDRVDLLIYDESGSWPNLTTAVVQGRALCEVQGVNRGIQVFGGTGGDKGPNLEGLKKIYYNPRSYKVLPFRHKWTQDGSIAETGFFIPYFLQSLNPKYMDSRGVCNIEEYKKVLTQERNALLTVPDDYIKHCAEYCWNAEEAFSQEGQNKFNKTIIANQLANIRLHKIGPKIETGLIDYTYKDGQHKLDNINGFRWMPSKNGKVYILEHPVWSNLYKEDIAKKKQEAIDKGEEFNAVAYTEMQDLYVAGIDGIDIGAAQTSEATKSPSDFCITIKKRAFGLNNPQYVAFYKDRPQNIREAYKIAMCLIKYYNCKANIEATRVGFLTWAREHKCLSYFMKRPTATLGNIKSKSNTYGTPATKVIINQQTDLIANFVEDYGDEIWFEEMLEQLQSYNDENKGKFDIIASMGMTELADQELSGRIPLKIEKDEDNKFQDIGYYTDEYGYKHFGVIPQKQQVQNIRLQYENDPYRNETSDTRLHDLVSRSSVYW